jgi:hypothetical protein
MTHSHESPALPQGIFFVATGAWPIVHPRSFEAITGPKLERWLVQTTGGLIAAVGAALIAASAERQRSIVAPVLGAASAAALAAADLVFVARRRISPVYLIDAALELGFVAGWARWLSGQRRRRSSIEDRGASGHGRPPSSAAS